MISEANWQFAATNAPLIISATLTTPKPSGMKIAVERAPDRHRETFGTRERRLR
jgi:hypothetical protein